jgi:hypothetical protein
MSRSAQGERAGSERNGKRGDAMLDAGGGGGSMYAVQIESLEEFQQKLTSILQSLEQDNTVMTMNDGTNSFGDFPEAQAFSSAYEQTKQDLINSFNEVTQLVNTMINVVGTNANKYKQTEQDITNKFNAILQQYGDAPTSPTPTSGSTTTYYPQSSTTSTTSTNTNAGANTGTGTGTNTGANTGTTTTTTTTTGSSGSSSSGGSTSSNTSAGAA